MEFDFQTFAQIASKAYEETDTKHYFSLDETLEVFRYFFKAYERYTGKVHPNIRKEQIRQIIEAMPYLDDEDLPGASGYADPEDYPLMIDAYFQTWFWNCNYRINHFFKGKIRTFRLFESI